MTVNATLNETIVGLYELASRNPLLLVIIAVQFILGFVAGYFTAKIAKYVLGLIGVFTLGAVLGVWGTASSMEDALKKLKALAEVKDVIYKLARIFGFMAMGPTFIGFIVGLITGIIKK